MIRTIIVEGGYSEECPPIKLEADNIHQIIKGLEFNYPQFKNKVYETKWTIIAKNSKNDNEFPFNEVMINEQLSLGDFDTVIFKPDPEGNFFLAPLLLSLMASMGSAAAAAAGAAGAAAAAGGGSFAVGAVAAGGMASVMGGLAVIGSMAIVMGAMYGLQQAFQPSQPKIGNPSAASGGDHGSFLYNNPPNVTEQGHPIPIVYGKVRTGGTVLSAELTNAKYRYVKKKWIPV
jgi:predicted phage tail protein